jgi:LacI family transcriptional regulator
MRDIAALAGGSVMTVRTLLNRPEIVRPPTRQRVLDAIEELGFVRNASARLLRPTLAVRESSGAQQTARQTPA